MNKAEFESYFGLFKSVRDTLLITPESMTPCPVLDGPVLEELEAWENLFVAIVKNGIEGERGAAQCLRFKEKFENWCKRKQQAWTEALIADLREQAEERFRNQRGKKRSK